MSELRFPHEEKMTEAQKACGENYLADVEAIGALLRERIEAAKAARVQLPAVNEQGVSVVVGCNNFVRNLEDLYTGVLRELTRMKA